MVPWWLPVDLPNISANTNCFEAWLVWIERSFQELSAAIETMTIVKELVEIWPNKVCDRLIWAPESFVRGSLTEFSLDSLYYLYNYYMVCVLLSHGSYVTQSCDITWLWLVTYDSVTLSHMILSCTPSLCSKCRKLHLAISPSILQWFSWSQWLQKALEKTFRSILVTPQSN